MKKVLSAALLFAILVGCFAVFAFAADEAPGVYHDQAYSAGADQYIDVDQYISNAGKSGYDELTLLGINSPYLHVDEHEDDIPYFALQYDFVFYNPLLVDISSDVPADVYINGDLGRLYNYSASDLDGKMFFVLSLRVYADKLASELLGKRIAFSDLTLYTSAGSAFIDFSRTVVFNDLGEIIEYTSPTTDLAYFNKTSESAVLDELETYDHSTIVYLYEKDYGCESYELYLYVYSPDASTFEFVTQYEPWEDDVDHSNSWLVPTYLFSDGGIQKYKVYNPRPSLLSSDTSQRDYYFAGIMDYDGNTHWGNWHFCYSDYEQTSTSYLFGFDYFVEYGGDEGRTAAWLDLVGYTNLIRDIDDIDPGDIFTLYFENKEFVSYDIVSPDLELLEVGDGYVRLIVNDDYSPSIGDLNDNSVQINEIRAYSPYPLFRNEWKDEGVTPPELAFTVTYTPWETGVESSEFLEACFTSAELQTYDPVLNTSSLYSVQRSSGEGLYLKVNTSETIFTKLHSTYYRLDSSVTANHNYQTLQSVYFSLSDKYLQKNELDIFSDLTVSAIEFEYWSAFLEPIIFTSNSDFYERWKDIYNDPSAYEDNLLATNLTKVSSSSLPSLDGGNNKYNCDYLIGDSIIGGGSYQEIFLPKYSYNVLNYLIYKPEAGDFEEFQEVLTAEELLEFLGDEPKLESALEYHHSTLFNSVTFDLVSYYDMTFSQVVDNYNLWNGFLHWLGLYDATKMESVNDIEAIRVVDSLQMLLYLAMDDEEISRKLYVALSDVPALRSEMESAVAEGRSLVFFRFDVYDYYAADVYEHVEHQDDTFLFKMKYYQDFDVLKLEISGKSESLVYNVDSESINIVTGVTSPDPVDYPDITDEDFFSRFLAAILEKIRELLMPFAWILVVPVVAFAGWGIVKIVSFVKTRRRK